MIANVKTYKARSMPEALAQVKRELGPDAVILGTRSISGDGLGTLMGRSAVEVTAAPASAVPQTHTPAWPRRKAVHTNGALNPAPQLTGGSGPALARSLEPLYRQLVAQEVSSELARQLIADAQRTLPPADALTVEHVAEATRRFIARTVPVVGGIDLPAGSSRRVALVGGSGGGKTTVVAKLAALYKLRHKRSVSVLSLDLQRVAAHDQMQRYGELIGVSVYGCQSPEAVRETLKQIETPDLLLIDTPGVGLRDDGRFARLASMLRACKPDEVHLALPASLSHVAQARMAKAFAPLGVSRVVWTHLDDAVGWGVVLDAIGKVPWGISYLSLGQRIPSDIEEACSERLAASILPSAVT